MVQRVPRPTALYGYAHRVGQQHARRPLAITPRTRPPKAIRRVFIAEKYSKL